MPTYSALGLSATLSVVDLETSLSEAFALRQGQNQQQDAHRVQDALTTGYNLPECPIGKDGTERGVLQFIGENEDMPFYMVETSESLRTSRHTNRIPPTSVPTLNRAQNVPDISFSSISTTNDLHPMSTRYKVSRSNSSPQELKADDEVIRYDSMDVDNAQDVSDNEIDINALSLAIDISPAAFLPQEGRARTFAKDLMIEIWLNGDLVNVTYVSKRVVGLDSKEIYKMLLGGTRIHRQSEKPWIYDTNAVSEDSNVSAEKRWKAVGQILNQEAKSSGSNKWGDRAPSSLFREALATLHFPTRMKGKDHLAIIDVIITAGKGRKYGPGAGYLMKPTPMESPEFCYKPEDQSIEDDGTTTSEESSEQMEILRCDSDLSDAVAKSTGYAEPSSPEIPLMQQRSTSMAFPDSPTSRAQSSIPSGQDVHANYKNLLVTVETQKGKTRRALGKRLGDFRQMSEDNRNAAFELLRKELDEEAFRAAKEIYNAKSSRGRPLPEKNEMPHPVAETKPSPSVAGKLQQANQVIASSTAILPTTSPAMPKGAEPGAMLTQKRIDIALDVGAASNGPLLRKISGSAPQSTPKRKTKAPSLANSPTSQAIKPQRHMIKQTPTANTAAIDNQAPSTARGLLTGTPSKSSSTNPRPRRRWNPNEVTPEEALDTFETPDLCKGSVLTYAGPGIHRQVAKARNGEFTEETLIVGMRFVVV